MVLVLEVPPAFRREIYRELGISLYTNSAAEESGLRWAQHYQFLSQQMAQQLGGPDRRASGSKQKHTGGVAENLALSRTSGCAFH
jgi:hypothetical protein